MPSKIVRAPGVLNQCPLPYAFSLDVNRQQCLQVKLGDLLAELLHEELAIRELRRFIQNFLAEGLVGTEEGVVLRQTQEVETDAVGLVPDPEVEAVIRFTFENEF